MKKILFLSLLFVFCFSLQAYAVPPYKIDDRASKNLDAPDPVLKKDDKIIIILPENGKYRNNVFPKSAAATAEKLNFAFRKYTSDVSVTGINMTMEEAKEHAAKNNFTHIAYPKILNWGEHLTAVSGRRVNISMHMIVFDAVNGKTVHDCIIYGNGSKFAVAIRTPDALLDKPLDVYVTTLFEGKKK